MRSMIVASVLTIGMAATAFSADDAAANQRKTTMTMSGRVGAQIEDQTMSGKEIWNYSAPFVGGQLDIGLPLAGPLSLNGLGILDLAYGSGTHQLPEDGPESTDFDEALARLKLQGTLAIDIPIDHLILTPFAGLGLRYWNWGDPEPNFRHIESWSAFYGVVGLRGEIRTKGATIFSQVDIQLPFSETISVEGNEYDFEDDDETTMVTAEAGLNMKKTRISLFGEFFTYKNDTQSANIGSEINKNTFGARIGYTF